MAASSKGGAALSVGLILLAVGCTSLGYGLCMLVNGMEGAAVLLGSGGAASALSTIFVVRSQQAAARN